MLNNASAVATSTNYEVINLKSHEVVNLKGTNVREHHAVVLGIAVDTSNGTQGWVRLSC